MPAVALLLVLVSALCHAAWNFLLKRAGGSHAFVALSKGSEAVVFLPAFLAVVAAGGTRGATVGGVAPYAVVGTGFVLAGYATLGAAYRHGDLSFVYPIARGATLLFLPLLGYVTFGEEVGAAGWAAVAAITAGVGVMQLTALSWAEVRAFRARAGGAAAGLALLMGLLLAGGAVWDKRAVRVVPLFAYFYAYTAAAGACYVAYVARREGWDALRAEWRARGRSAVAVGVLNTTSYGLALVALRDGTATYVVGVRQLSIVVGVALGAWLLGERVSAPRRLGVGLVVAGCLLMATGR